MKIAHVVTYVSPDGAYGGPTRVALGQAEALAEKGHDVTVFAAAPRELAGVVVDSGYTLRTFPARRIAPVGGFATMVAPQLLRAVHADASSFDVAHIHLARDLVTLPAALQFRRAAVPYVVQTHGMIDAPNHLLARPIDVIATRPLLRDAVKILTLTDRERDDVTAIEHGARTVRINNGVRLGVLTRYEAREDMVLFLARLHERKRPLAFVQMARNLRDMFPETRFVLAGPDEGEGNIVRSAIESAGMGDRLEWIGAVSPDRTDALLARARAYVLPAFNEVFPMTILEAWKVGTPVVTTSSLGIAGDCQKYSAALVTDGSPAQLAIAVARVLNSPGEAARLRAGGQEFLSEELDIARLAEVLVSIYTEPTGDKARPRTGLA